MFLVPGTGVRREISSMPGIFNLSVDQAAEEALKYVELGISSVLLFGIPQDKDDSGSYAWADDGIIQIGLASLKKAAPELNLITDLCFCEYTTHGHCGIIKDGDLDNEATLEIIIKQTLSHAKNGADLIAPSGMIDGAVGTMRQALDENGFSNLPIMAYSAKFASSFYGPFRQAAQCAPQFGDRRTYQMDPANLQEAMREIELDIEEGADIIMVKPAMAYMDVIREAKNSFSLPLAAYNVSGEYAMVKAAAANGWIDGERIAIELLYGLKRAGADLIISYFTEEMARRFNGSAITY
jgi:porphobilinogen synthase